MADRFEDLRNYVAVVSNGGVNAAADALGIAKSAVSRRLAELEARLGVALIDRTTRRLELTAVGRDYHRRAVELLSSLDELDQSVGGKRAVVERLKVSADEELAPMVAAALASFQRVHPGIIIALTLLAGGISESADLVVTTSEASTAGREGVHVGEYRAILCASPDYLNASGEPASTADLSDHAVVGTAAQAGGWTFDGRPNQPFRAVITVPDAICAELAAAKGAGIAQLPEFVVRNALNDGRLRRVLADKASPTRTVLATFATDSSVSVRQLADHLAAKLDLKG